MPYGPEGGILTIFSIMTISLIIGSIDNISYGDIPMATLDIGYLVVVLGVAVSVPSRNHS
eukprot:2561604-Pleurochrysis_carterae.AAC.1